MSGTSGQRRRRQREEVVICRYVGLGQTFFAAPMIVDHDDDRSIGVYLAPGTPFKRLRSAGESPLPRVVPPGYFERVETTMEHRIRDRGPSLVLWRPGGAHAVHVHWRGHLWEPDGFYVNLQEPMTETPDGFETTDLFLDIVVERDLQWRWKDEDELEEAVAVGRITAREAEAVRLEGERVVADIEARRWPFDGSYDNWRPDPAWPLPIFPKDWNIE